MSNQSNKGNILRNPPYFTHEHVEYLEQCFREDTTVPDSPYELYRRLGVRHVVNQIRDLHDRQIKKVNQ